MSFIIKNISGGVVEVDDLGIYMETAEELDITDNTGEAISGSTDLVTAIQVGDLIALDPLDDVTPLTVDQSVEAVQSFNDPHFRIRGGELAQLDDVASTNPLDEYVLTYVGSNNRWEPKPSSGGGPGPSGTCFPFFRANGTQDNITVTLGKFPFFRADGTQDNIDLTTC